MKRINFSLSGNTAGERPLSSVPVSIRLLLVISLALQLVYHGLNADIASRVRPLPEAPTVNILEAMALGEPVALSRLLMLWLQGFDYQPGISIPFSQLDYGRLTRWLEQILSLDPRSHYPLLSAARVYTRVADNSKQRQMLDLVYRKFQEDPAARWPWLAHAVYVAKHRMGDQQLALQYARALRLQTSPATAPDWARQMELFVLEDIGDIESARILLGGLIESGEVSDPREITFLTSRLGVEGAEANATTD